MKNIDVLVWNVHVAFLYSAKLRFLNLYKLNEVCLFEAAPAGTVGHSNEQCNLLFINSSLMAY